MHSIHLNNLHILYGKEKKWKDKKKVRKKEWFYQINRNSIFYVPGLSIEIVGVFTGSLNIRD